MTHPKVPLLDLRSQYASIQTEILDVVARVLDSQQFILGPEVEAFESELADYCGTEHAIGMSSGTDALLAALMALDIGPGDEVITTPYSFFATAGSIARVGATPVFVDIDPVTYNLDPDRILHGITGNTKAIMPVHLYGQCAEMDPILELAHRHGVAVIEDAAQAIGAEYRGRRAGAMGAIGCFSFFPTKNLGAFGDAGAVTTNDAELADKLRLIRTHGQSSTYRHARIGGNFRLDALQAAILSVKLRYLDDWTEARQRNAGQLTRLLAERGLVNRWVQPPASVQVRHVFNQYVVRLADRDAAQEYLKRAGVGTRIYYPLPLHLQECFAALGYRPGDMPHSELAANSTLALPIYPELTYEQLAAVASAIQAYYQPEVATRRRAA